MGCEKTEIQKPVKNKSHKSTGRSTEMCCASLCDCVIVHFTCRVIRNYIPGQTLNSHIRSMVL